ncbi:MAG TPA: hypothetical protein ENJ30_01195 [Desulfobulbaceae bacterium]|nr:hypothetical protein [Desulfobulbaceae bacterium]
MKTIYLSIIVFICLLPKLPAQQLTMEWRGSRDSAPAGNGVIVTDVDDMTDYNDDGIRDLPVVIRTDRVISVTSGADKSQKWVYTPPQDITSNMDIWKVVGGFRIFADGFEYGNTSGLKAMVLAQKNGSRYRGLLETDRVKYEGGVVVFNKRYGLVGIDDYDNDTLFELLLYDRVSGRMEMWGEGN